VYSVELKNSEEAVELYLLMSYLQTGHLQLDLNHVFNCSVLKICPQNLITLTMSVSLKFSREIGQDLFLGDTISQYLTFLVALSICELCWKNFYWFKKIL